MGPGLFPLIVKELLAAWRDPRGRFILIGPPLMQLLLFTYAATQEVTNVRMAVLNEDYGTAARDLIARFEGSPNFAQVSFLRGEADIAPAVDSRRVLMVLHIGPNFSRQLAAGRPGSVQLILDGRCLNSGPARCRLRPGHPRRLRWGVGRPQRPRAAQCRRRPSLVQPEL